MCEINTCFLSISVPICKRQQGKTGFLKMCFLLFYCTVLFLVFLFGYLIIFPHSSVITNNQTNKYAQRQRVKIKWKLDDYISNHFWSTRSARYLTSIITINTRLSISPYSRCVSGISLYHCACHDLVGILLHILYPKCEGQNIPCPEMWFLTLWMLFVLKRKKNTHMESICSSCPCNINL